MKGKKRIRKWWERLPSFHEKYPPRVYYLNSKRKKETYLKEKDAHSTASSSLPDIKAARDRWEKVCLNLQSREILLSFSIRVSNLLIMISSSSTHCWVNTRRKRGEKKTKERWEMWQNKDWMNSEGREKSRPEKGSSYESLITSLLES